MRLNTVLNSCLVVATVFTVCVVYIVFTVVTSNEDEEKLVKSAASEPLVTPTIMATPMVTATPIPRSMDLNDYKQAHHWASEVPGWEKGSLTDLLGINWKSINILNGFKKTLFRWDYEADDPLWVVIGEGYTAHYTDQNGDIHSCIDPKAATPGVDGEYVWAVYSNKVTVIPKTPGQSSTCGGLKVKSNFDIADQPSCPSRNAEVSWGLIPHNRCSPG